MDHASVGPLSTHVTEALQQHLYHRSAGEVNTFARDVEHAQRCRVLLSRLLNAESAERIAFCPNTSDALNIVAAGLQLGAGDAVLLNDAEFPSNVYPFLHLRSRGVHVEFLRAQNGVVTAEAVESALWRLQSGDLLRVKALSLSAVQFLSGFRADIGAIGEVCKRHGVVFIVDAIQALGVVPIDVRAMHIDALASGGQKWLMATTGIAFLYVSAALQERLQQPTLGWTSVQTPWDFFRYDQPLAPTARRYENGTLNFPGIIALKASLETLLVSGIEAIQEHVLALTDTLLSGLQVLAADTGLLTPVTFARQQRAGIVSAKLESTRLSRTDAERIVQDLLDKKISISLREGHIRFSPHCYNTQEEIKVTLEALQYALQQGCSR
jgi:selenocysteine lyase/cysteine desulfurase